MAAGNRLTEAGLRERIETELVIPVFGYKNHLGIDRRRGFIRNFLVTDASISEFSR